MGKEANQEDDYESNFPSTLISLNKGEVNEGSRIFLSFPLFSSHCSPSFNECQHSLKTQELDTK